MIRGRSLFDLRVDDMATPYLQEFLRDFPDEYNRALRSTGFWLKGEFQRAMNSDGATIGQNWQKRSQLAMYRRIPLLRQGYFSELLQRWTHSGKLKLRRGKSLNFYSGKDFQVGSEHPFGGKLPSAVRWKLTKDQVQIGFLNRRAAAYAAAVQDGRRGDSHLFEHSESQQITEDMRRMFWAAGIPLARGKSALNQPPRPLVKPLFDQRKQEILARITYRIEAYIRGLSSQKATAYVRRALRSDA